MKKRFSFFLFLCSTLSFYAQDVRINQELIDTISTKFVNAPLYEDIKKGLEDDASLNGWTKYYLFKSFKSLAQRENDSAVFYAQKGIEVFDTREKTLPIAEELIHKLYYIKGLVAYFDGRIEESLKTLNLALEHTNSYSVSLENTSWKFYILERISIIHAEKGDHELALKAKKEKLKDSVFMSFKYNAGNTYLDIGISYFEYLKELDTAKFYFKKAIKRYHNPSKKDFRTTDENTYFTSVVIAYNMLGDLFYEETKVDSALAYYTQAHDLLKEKNLKRAIVKDNTRFYTKANYAFILSKKNKLDSAIYILNNVIDSLRTYTEYSRDERGARLKSHNFLSEVYSQNGQYKQAYTSQKELNQYLLKYNEENISKQLQLFSTQYEVAEKNASITKFEKNQINQQLIIEQRNIINWVLIGLLLSITGLGVLLFKRRKEREKYKSANLEQRLLRSQLNPHFLFNALTTASNLAHQKSEKTTAYISKLGNLLRSVLENSREEFISLREEVETLESYLELQSNFSKRFRYRLEIDQSLDQDVIYIPPMFIQPFIENAIAHGITGKVEDRITIRIQEDGQALYCCIEDNGIGYSKTLEHKNEKLGHKSLSGKILKERLALYAKSFKTKARYTIEDLTKEGGTKVELWLPYTI